jgi:hypothetical protein
LKYGHKQWYGGRSRDWGILKIVTILGIFMVLL